MRIEQLHIGTEFGQFQQVDGAVLIDPVMNERLAVRRRSNDSEERQVVDIETRERHRVDLVLVGVQLRGLDRDIDQPSEVVARTVFLPDREPQAHLVQDRQLDLQEFDRGAGDGQFGMGHDGRGDQAHRLDRVLRDGVGDILVELRLALDAQGGRPDAFDLDAQHHEEDTQILHHVVGGGVAQHRLAGRHGGGHQGVFGDGVTTFGKHDGVLRMRMQRGRVVVALGGNDIEAEGVQRLHVRLDGAGTQLAAAGVGQPEGVRQVHQGPEEHDDAAGTTGGRDIHIGQIEHLGTHDRQIGLVGRPGDLHADALQHFDEPVDLFDMRNATQPGAAAIQQTGAQQGHGRVLRRTGRDGSVQRGLTGDGQIHRIAAARHDQRGLEGLSDTVDHLERQVLIARLDPMDRALTRAEQRRKFILGEATLFASVPHEPADAGCGGQLSHPGRITHM